MNATTVIELAQSAGLTLTVTGDSLNIKGVRTPEFDRVIELIKPIKADVVAALSAAAAVESLTTLEEELTLDPLTDDAVLFVGAIITQEELDALQKRASANGNTLHARPSGDKWYVTGYSVRAMSGKIIAGGAPDAGHYRYTIKPGTPLYYRARDNNEYKRWLWPRIQDDQGGDAAVIAELYAIINGAWVGCDVYVDGPFSDVVVAAAGWLYNQYTVDGLPIFTKGKTPV